VEQARKAAGKAKEQIREGENPADNRRAERTAATVAQLVERFATEHLDMDLETRERIHPGAPHAAVRLSTAMEYARILNRYILPALGTRRVKDITPGDVADLLFKLRKDTPIMANRVRAVLSKLFTKAELWSLRPPGSNPTKGQDRAPERKKDRFLSEQELVALGRAWKAMEPMKEESQRDAIKDPAVEDLHALAAVRLLLLTGMRKSELIGDLSRDIPALKWSDVDLKARVIRLEQHKTAKRTGTRLVPLCAPACAILESLPEVLGNPHVIPGGIKGQPLVNLQCTWERSRAAVTKIQDKAKTPKKQRVDIEDVTLHDLRRTFASVGASLGYPELFLAALLGHSAGTVTQGYARVGVDPLRDVVEAIGGRIHGLLSGTIDLEKEAGEAKATASTKHA
jgi:integrase